MCMHVYMHAHMNTQARGSTQAHTHVKILMTFSRTSHLRLRDQRIHRKKTHLRHNKKISSVETVASH